MLTEFVNQLVVIYWALNGLGGLPSHPMTFLRVDGAFFVFNDPNIKGPRAIQAVLIREMQLAPK